MRESVSQQITYDHKSGIRTYSPWYLARGLFGGRIVGEEAVVGRGIPPYLGIAYRQYCRRALVLYPKPLHLVVRLLHYLSGYCWTILRFLYWIGLIDTGTAECFRWADFYRIKAH